MTLEPVESLKITATVAIQHAAIDIDEEKRASCSICIKLPLNVPAQRSSQGTNYEHWLKARE